MGRGAPSRGIVFVCMGNSIRSQIAEAIARSLAPEGIEVFSAGLAPGIVHPVVFDLMDEVGIDVHGQTSKGLAAIPWGRVGTVVSLSRDVSRALGGLPGGVRRVEWEIEVPVLGPDRETRERSGRAVRDEIHRRIRILLAEIVAPGGDEDPADRDGSERDGTDPSPTEGGGASTPSGRSPS